MPRTAKNPNSDIDGCLDSDLDGLIGYNLKRAYMLVQTDFRNALGDDDLTPRVFSALSLVVQAPGITQSELSRLLNIERSGLVAIIDQLETAGMLKRVAVPGDRRVQALSPTGEGQQRYAAALESVRLHEERLFASLSAAERSQLLSNLLKFRQANEKTD